MLDILKRLVKKKPATKSPFTSSSSLMLEQLETRLLLNADLPGLHLVDPPVEHFDGQIIYLDFDGAEDVTYNGPVVVEGIDIPSFSTEAAGLSGQEQQVIS